MEVILNSTHIYDIILGVVCIRATNVESMSIEVHRLNDANVIAALDLLDVCPSDVQFVFQFRVKIMVVSNRMIVLWGEGQIKT